MSDEQHEQVWCSRCGEPYPGPADPTEPYYAGDDKLWVHGGIFLGLGHKCDGEFNNATNVQPALSTRRLQC